MMKLIKDILNRLDDPIDNLKHALHGEHRLYKSWYLVVKVPMKGKNYYGFELAIIKKKGE